MKPDFFPLSECALEGQINLSEYLSLPRPQGQELREGRRLKREINRFKTQAKARAKSAASGPSNVPGITLFSDGTWTRDGIKPIHSASAPGVTPRSMADDQCYKCGVYSVHRTGLCKDCR